MSESDLYWYKEMYIIFSASYFIDLIKFQIPIPTSLEP